MMTSPGELLEREDLAWSRVWAAVERVPADDRMREGVVGDWSTQDIVWHCAYWTNFCAEHLEAMRTGPWSDPFAGESDEQIDRENQDIADASKAMKWADVVSGTDASRARVRAALSAFADVDGVAEAWFADETFVHYDEHAEEIRSFLDANR